MYKEKNSIPFDREASFREKLQITHGSLNAVIMGRQEAMSPVTTSRGMVEVTSRDIAAAVRAELRQEWGRKYPGLFKNITPRTKG